MKAISLWQPWASLCVTTINGKSLKEYETRSWNTLYRGKLLIHAALKKVLLPEFNESIWIDAFAKMGKPKYGSIVGMVDLIETMKTDNANINRFQGLDISENIQRELKFGNWTPGRFAWKFENPILFENPMPFKGKQGFFNISDEDVEICLNMNNLQDRYAEFMSK